VRDLGAAHTTASLLDDKLNVDNETAAAAAAATSHCLELIVFIVRIITIRITDDARCSTAAAVGSCFF